MLERSSRIKEKVFRVLLNHPTGELTKYRLAKKANCSYPSTHRILKKLESMRLVKGTRVKNYEKLIRMWKDWKIKRDTRDYVINNPMDILHKTKMTYALTTSNAENLIQGYLFPTKVEIYVRHEDKLRWHNYLMKRDALVGRGNLRIIMTYDETFYNLSHVRGFSIVSNPQLIVDLLRGGGTETEAAEIFLKKVNQ